MYKTSPISLAILAVLLFAFQCMELGNKELVSDTCIDPSKINKNAPCYMIYDPVCGCDGKTYGNDCDARNNGVLTFVKGKCN